MLRFTNLLRQSATLALIFIALSGCSQTTSDDLIQTQIVPATQPVPSAAPPTSTTPEIISTQTPVASTTAPPTKVSTAPERTLTETSSAAATISGQVIAGYGDHQPVAGLPLRIRQKNINTWDTYTDENGYFTLTNLPLGRIDVENSHLSFWLTIDSSSQFLDLGKLRYPLIHPPDYYWWQAAPLADFTQLLDEGKPVSFEVCAADAGWMRPDHDTQQEKVYAQLPFSQLDEKSLEKFEQTALMYDTVDVTQQSFPGGLNLDELGADWLYLTGLWTAAKDPFLNSDCSYAPGDLQSLFERSQLEVWLFGYQTTGLRELDKERAEIAPDSLCDPGERSCTVRPGYHYAVQVEPASGFQIIRFTGEQDVLLIHIIESGKEIMELP